MGTISDELMRKIKVLNENVWEQRVSRAVVDEWLDNFEGPSDPSKDERLHALYLLSQFMYFGDPQIREILRALFRDLYKYPIVEAVRRENHDTTDVGFIEGEFKGTLAKTRFLGLGNPSESGCHLLYYFRQENRLPASLFIHTHEIFSRTRTGNRVDLLLKEPDVLRYVFIDDFCGSGDQAKGYSADLVDALLGLKSEASVCYYVLFGRKDGLDLVRNETLFTEVKCVCELDDSYKCFHEKSRYFLDHKDVAIDKAFAEKMCERYGIRLLPDDPLGFDDGQLLIGFHHNTPDNTLPIIWYDEPGRHSWTPVFRRYPKEYYTWE